MVDKRAYADRREYLIKAVAKRRKALKEKAIQYGGRRCNICGYNREVTALEFHHLDESKKDFGLSQRGLTRSWKKYNKSWISAYWFVPIATEKSTQVKCSSHQKW